MSAFAGGVDLAAFQAGIRAVGLCRERGVAQRLDHGGVKIELLAQLVRLLAIELLQHIAQRSRQIGGAALIAFVVMRADALLAQGCRGLGIVAHGAIERLHAIAHGFGRQAEFLPGRLQRAQLLPDVPARRAAMNAFSKRSRRLSAKLTTVWARSTNVCSACISFSDRDGLPWSLSWPSCDIS